MNLGFEVYRAVHGVAAYIYLGSFGHNESGIFDKTFHVNAE